MRPSLAEPLRGSAGYIATSKVAVRDRGGTLAIGRSRACCRRRRHGRRTALQPRLEEILSWVADDEWGAKTRKRIERSLDRDGYSIDASGRIRPVPDSLRIELPVENLRDHGSLLEHLERLRSYGASDPGMAVSQAKALVEATTKLVLEELDVEYDAKAKMPVLAREAQRALSLHPDLIAPTTKGAETVKSILRSLGQVATGLAELRNQFGPDHGRATSVRLSSRHANLAIGAAYTYCLMLLETLEARRSSGS